MDNRTYTAKARIARLSPDDLIRLVNDADRLVRATRPQPLETQARELRADWSSPQPHWYLSERHGNVQQSRNGSAEEIAPDISLPKRHRYVSVTTHAGGNSIEFTISRGGARFDVGSTDSMWFLMAKAWADESLQRMTPRWAWLTSQWLYVVLLLIGGLTAVASSSLFLAGSLPTPLAITGSVIGIVLMAAAGLTTSLPRSYIGPRRAPSGANYFRVASGYVIAGVIGWFIARIGDALWPG